MRERPHGYDKHLLEDCECDVCVAAYRARSAAKRWWTTPFNERRVLSRPEAKPVGAGRTHGRRATYISGCKCGPCMEANRVYQNARRAAIRQARRQEAS